MKVVTVLRDTIGNDQSTGVILVQDKTGKILFTCQSLERGWRNNERNVSCIPEGTYPLKLEHSPRFNSDLWEVYEVPNRSECKFHVANYWHQLNGCIAPGLKQADINGDGVIDNTSSRVALKGFHQALLGESEAELRVINNVFA